MDFGIRDRVALVSAGSKGLGRAIAETLAAEGARVVVCARGAAALDATCRGIVEAGGRCHGIAADVSVPGDVAKVVAEAESTFGSVDILVTNSGGPKSGRFETLTPEDWDAAARLLLSSAVGFARAVVPGMRARKWGRIINVTSIAAKQPVDGLMLSNSLRAGVVAFARTLSTEVARDGITVNNLLPGYTRTQRVLDLSGQMAAAGGTTPEDIVKRWEAEIPMQRLGEPRELAALAAFLASEQAAYMTGQSIAVDGGWIRGLF
ncbi:MAG TPA: SDR family oxidoreductase [Vicinamibacterales bacterium]|nr:SDR family oxidoreductase [Vicinamibacterales bacterium]